MTVENKYFTEKEMVERLQEVLEYYAEDYSELHNEAFNSDYYIIGSYKAEQALVEYGVFKAIGEIVEYEKDNFGEVSTDLADPEKIANMLYYILSENFMNEIEMNCILEEAAEDLDLDESEVMTATPQINGYISRKLGEI